MEAGNSSCAFTELGSLKVLNEWRVNDQGWLKIRRLPDLDLHPFFLSFNSPFQSPFQLPKDSKIQGLQQAIERQVGIIAEIDSPSPSSLYKPHGRAINQQQRRRHISWRSVWRTTDLDYEGSRLAVAVRPNHLKLADYGITEGARIRFVRRKFSGKGACLPKQQQLDNKSHRERSSRRR